MVQKTMPPIELAERLALLPALAFFLGLAFEENYKRDETTIPGGIRTFPLVGLAGAMLYLVEPHRLLAFGTGLLAIGAWLYAFLRHEQSLETGSDRTLVFPVSNLLVYAPRTDRLDATPLGRRRRDRRGGASYRDARADARLCAPDPAGRGPDRREVSHSRRHYSPARARSPVDRALARPPLSHLACGDRDLEPLLFDIPRAALPSGKGGRAPFGAAWRRVLVHLLLRRGGVSTSVVAI